MKKEIEFLRVGTHISCKDTVWGCVQWIIACCSSWTPSSALLKSQAGEDLGFHVAVSKRRVVDTQYERGNTANDISWEEHVLGNWFILNLTTEFAKERQSLIPD
jgi:hypothetical protein